MDSDGVQPPLLRGNTIYRMSGVDEPVRLPVRSTEQAQTYFPTGPTGARVSFFELVPESEASGEPEDLEAAIAESERLLPGISEIVVDPEADHATATVDVLYVISGKADLEFDDGLRTTLAAGDLIVQNGTTSHTWSNPYDEPFVALMTTCGPSRRLTRAGCRRSSSQPLES